MKSAFKILIFAAATAMVSSASFAATTSDCYVMAAGQKAKLPLTSRMYRDTYNLQFQLVENATGAIEIKPFTEQDALVLLQHSNGINVKSSTIPVIAPIVDKVELFLWRKDISVQVMTAQVRVYTSGNQVRATDEMHVLFGNLNYDVDADAPLLSNKASAGAPEPLTYKAPVVKADGSYDRTMLKISCDPVK